MQIITSKQNSAYGGFLRKIIKGIDEEADITKFDVFYYPIWYVAWKIEN